MKSPLPDFDITHGYLQLAAETLSDIEGIRVALNNRIAAWDRNKLPDGPERQRFVLMHDTLKCEEDEAVLELKRALKRSPYGPWIKKTIGVGEKQGARLLAAIGDPAWNERDDRFRRNAAELRKYCGLTPDDKKRRGQRAAWNHEAKMRLHLIAESCVKALTSPFRPVYDGAREKYDDRLHTEPCPRCGPRGKPALEGSPLSKGHQHARALREVSQAVLDDLFDYASCLHARHVTYVGDDQRNIARDDEERDAA